MSAGSVPAGYLLRARFVRAEYDDGEAACASAQHAHPEHVVLWPEQGVLVVRVNGVEHEVVHGQGLWVPARVPHSLGRGRATAVAVHVAPEAMPGGGERVHVVEVVAAVRELLIYMAENGMAREDRVRAQRVCLSLITKGAAPVAPLPLAHDVRVAEICRHVLADPGDNRSLEEWAWQLSVSSRTLARAFKESTGQTYGRWRTAARIERAMRLLDRGTPVGEVARDVGYGTVSAFSSAFTRETGGSPSDYHPGKR